jgi:ferric-dicitrate binding protein FerR (iron transport regulator)
MTEDQFIQLLQGFHDRRLSEEELLSFLKAAEDPRFESLIGDRLHAELAEMKALPVSDGARADKVWQTIHASINGTENKDAGVEVEIVPADGRVRFLSRPWIRYAAAVIVLLGVGAYFWLSNRQQPVDKVVTTDIAPGREGAILTLADGSKVVLDSLGNGMVAEQHGTQVVLKDGSLSYNASNASTVSYNTMATPNGRQFSVQLPDGSKAWLNAASSITYPTAFIGNERPVSISGEVYFEVVKDAKRPFKVKVNDNTEVQVLGTSFNVKAYAEDASVNTTLLEGSVRLSVFQKTQMLAPGQQTMVSRNGNIRLVNHADIQKIMAWKNGLFNFQDESLEEVMKQLERWYDIQVKYIGDPPKKKFFGELGRDLTLSQVIETLQEVGIQFHIEGRTLFVRH